MKPLNLPPYTDMRLKASKTGKPQVFDVLRRRYVSLTPEEWVRQHFVNYLVAHLGYPMSLMANEMELRVGEKHLRCDSVLFDSTGKPKMIMEYKAPEIQITEKVLNQILSYNTQLGVEYLIMSNGLMHVVMHYNKETNQWAYLADVPLYEELK